MKSTLTPKAHKRKFTIAKSHQKGLLTENAFRKVVDSDKKKQEAAKLKQLQQVSKK